MIVALVAAVALCLATVLPALAYQEEGGYKNCGAKIGYTHVHYNGDGWGRGPGSSVIVWWDWPPSSGWHTDETNGDYAGDWFGRGEVSLDFVNTYPGCRSYG